MNLFSLKFLSGRKFTDNDRFGFILQGKDNAPIPENNTLILCDKDAEGNRIQGMVGKYRMTVRQRVTPSRDL